MILVLVIYIIGYILAFIMLVYNESRYSNLTKFDLITYASMSLISWLIVICELPTTIKISQIWLIAIPI